MGFHISHQAHATCYATFWSYGEICVGCGCCGKPSPERDHARLLYWRALLAHDEGFSQWHNDPTIRAGQERNRRANIRYAKRHIRYYEKKRGD